jgi:hypothetical protein
VVRFFDFVRVYEGEDDSGPLLGTISGDHYNHSGNFPVDYATDGPNAALFLHFEVSDEVAASTIPQFGFQATFTAPYCGDVTSAPLTDPRGTITDGSGTSPFLPKSHCTWVVSPGFAGVRVIMKTMALREGVDTVRIYDGSAVNSSRLLAEWSGTYEGTFICAHDPPYSVATTGKEAQHSDSGC